MNIQLIRLKIIYHNKICLTHYVIRLWDRGRGDVLSSNGCYSVFIMRWKIGKSLARWNISKYQTRSWSPEGRPLFGGVSLGERGEVQCVLIIINVYAPYHDVLLHSPRYGMQYEWDFVSILWCRQGLVGIYSLLERRCLRRIIMYLRLVCLCYYFAVKKKKKKTLSRGQVAAGAEYIL